jgi:ferric-dicitrate binding protein FerR (iron transport regulator)
MDCSRARELAYYHVDKELAPADTRELEAHLGACEDCRRFVRELQDEGEMLRSYFAEAQVAVSAEAVAERVLQSVSSPRSSRVHPWWRRSMALVAAAALVLAVAAAIMWAGRHWSDRVEGPSAPLVASEDGGPTPPSPEPVPMTDQDEPDGGPQPAVAPPTALGEDGASNLAPGPRPVPAPRPRPGPERQRPAPGPPSCGRLVRAEHAWRAGSGSGEWTSVAAGADLHPGDRLRTAAGGLAVAEFAGGITVDLETGTQIALAESTGAPDRLGGVSLTAGKLLAEVESGGDFEVVTPLATATVTGTRFLLSATDSRAVLVVIAGSVGFRNEHGRVGVGEMQRSVALRGQAPGEPIPMRSVAWRGRVWAATAVAQAPEEVPREMTLPERAEVEPTDEPEPVTATWPELPPMVVDSTPKPFEANVDTNLAEMTLTFDRPMEASGREHLLPLEFLGGSPLPDPGAMRWSDDLRTCVLALALEPDATYAVSLRTPESWFDDLAGTNAVPFSLVFSTGSLEEQDMAPHVIATDPVQRATDVDPTRRQVRITYSVPLSPGSLAGTAMALPDCAEYPAGSAQPVLSEDRRTLVLDVRLQPDTVYAMQLSDENIGGSCLRDSRGRAAVPFALCFQTRAMGGE